MKISVLRHKARRPTAFAWMVALGCSGSMVAACGGDDSTASNETSSGRDASVGVTVTEAIGAAGGTLTAADGTSITIPPGALGSTQTISITQASSAEVPGAIVVAGTPYVFGPEGLQFSVPVTLTLDVNPTEIPSGKAESDLIVYTAPVGTTSFTKLPATVVDATHVSTQTTHFSIFVPGLDNGDGGVSPVDASIEDATTPHDGGGEPVDGGAGDDGGTDGSTPPPATPTVLASAQLGPESIAVDGTSLYWTNTAGGTVQKTALDGSAPVTLASGQTTPFGIVVDASTVYWTAVFLHTPPNFPITNTAIYSESLANLGSAPTTLSTLGGDVFQGLALNGSTLLVSTQYGYVYSVPTASGTQTTLAASQGFAQDFVGNVAADGTNAYWVTAATTGGGEAGVTGPNGSVFAEPYAAATAPSTVSGSTAGENYAVATDGTNVYFSNSLGDIESVPTSGGTAKVLATSALTESFDAGAPLDASPDAGTSGVVSNAIYGIAVDGTYVYWTTNGGTLNAVPKAGGAVRVLASEPGAAYYGIALDANNVYWTDASQTAGRILTTPKP